MNKSVFWSIHPQDANHGGEFEVSVGDVKPLAMWEAPFASHDPVAGGYPALVKMDEWCDGNRHGARDRRRFDHGQSNDDLIEHVSIEKLAENAKKKVAVKVWR